MNITVIITASATALAAGATLDPPVSPASANAVMVRAGTTVDFAIDGELSSRTSRIDDIFAIHTTADVTIDGKSVVPAGTSGVGQVIHAAKSGGLGRGGELLLTVRYVECGAEHVPLSGFQLGNAGADRSDVSLVAGAVIPFGGLLVKGRDVVFASQTPAHAKVAADTAVVAGCGR